MSMDIYSIISDIESINDKFGSNDYLDVKIVLNYKDSEINTGGFGECCSWRGDYREPCLTLGDNTDSEQLLKELYFLKSGNIFFGYKGGEYRYNGNMELTVEPCYSSYTGDGYIDSVEYLDGVIVITCNKE